MNKVMLMGRITKDLEIKSTSSEKQFLNFTLAVSRKFSKGEANFFNCQAWNKTAEIMAQYLKKGSQIVVEGELNTRSYDNKEGQKIYITEVIVESFHFTEKAVDKPIQVSTTSQDNPIYDDELPF